MESVHETLDRLKNTLIRQKRGEKTFLAPIVKEDEYSTVSEKNSIYEFEMSG